MTKKQIAALSAVILLYVGFVLGVYGFNASRKAKESFWSGSLNMADGYYQSLLDTHETDRAFPWGRNHYEPNGPERVIKAYSKISRHLPGSSSDHYRLLQIFSIAVFFAGAFFLIHRAQGKNGNGFSTCLLFSLTWGFGGAVLAIAGMFGQVMPDDILREPWSGVGTLNNACINEGTGIFPHTLIFRPALALLCGFGFTVLALLWEAADVVKKSKTIPAALLLACACAGYASLGGVFMALALLLLLGQFWYRRIPPHQAAFPVFAIFCAAVLGLFLGKGFTHSYPEAMFDTWISPLGILLSCSIMFLFLVFAVSARLNADPFSWKWMGALLLMLALFIAHWHFKDSLRFRYAVMGSGILLLLILGRDLLTLYTNRFQFAEFFLFSWILLALVFGIGYFPFRDRVDGSNFLFGLWLPLCCFGQNGLERLALQFQRKGAWAAKIQSKHLFVSLLCLTVFTPAYYSATLCESSAAALAYLQRGEDIPWGRHEFSEMLTKDEKAMMDYIRDDIKESTGLFLVAPNLSVNFPRYSGKRSLILYADAAPKPWGRETEILRDRRLLFSPDLTSATKRREILELHGIDYVLYGPREFELIEESDFRSLMSKVPGVFHKHNIGGLHLYEIRR